MQQVTKTYKTVFILGLMVAFVPYAGFPRAWDTVFLTIVGLAIAFLSFSLRRLYSPALSSDEVRYVSGNMREADVPIGESVVEKPKARPRRPRKKQEEAVPVAEEYALRAEFQGEGAAVEMQTNDGTT